MDKPADGGLLVKSVATGYGKKRILNGVSLHVDAGELVAIIGHNGSGKSTLLKAIFGLLPCWNGEISFQGRDLAGLSQRERLQGGLAYLPQGNRVFAELTVRENLAVACACLRNGARQEDAIERALQLFPALRQRLAQSAGNLSGGEKQMLALARSLVLAPRMLLLDEPSLGLAASVLRSTFDNIKTLSSQSKIACLIVEQNVREVLRIAHRVYVLRNGEVSYDGPSEALNDPARLQEVYI